MKYFTTLMATLLTSAAFAQAALPATEAEVRKVDKDAGKITLKHGEIKNLDMPAMSMVFQVKDKALLDKVKAGDKVSFTADKIDGAYTVLSIEPSK
ncbi:copper-binding protein [Polaromonas sp.]|uniref:copper-binding protein n=1 Tax=Polaromonas sp. TaxID=1869339 RepID=UPI003C9CE104